MANQNAIYRKTPKGVEAMASRQSGLAPRLRSLLIMVDGKRSHAELAAMAAALGSAEQLLQLETEGFMAPMAALENTVPLPLEPGAPPSSPPSAPMSAAERAARLVKARGFASHLLENTLGPVAEPLCIKIEAARSFADFVAAVKRARDIVREIKGDGEADRFIAQVEAQLPPE
jgi:hypothetical protein